MNEVQELIKNYEEGKRLDPAKVDEILTKASQIAGSGVEWQDTSFFTDAGRAGEPESKQYLCLDRYVVTISFEDGNSDGSVVIFDDGIEKRLTDASRLIE